MKTIEELIKEKEELEKRIEGIREDEKRIQEEFDNFELDVDDYEEQFKEYIDEEGTVTVMGIEFDRHRILEELDPTAYRCGLNDFVDSCDKEDDYKYIKLNEQLEHIGDILVDLENDLGDLETQIEEMESDNAN